MLNIEQELGNLSKITLNENDYIGQGINAKVYKYSLQNHALAVKCYKIKQGAEEEKKILDQIKTLTKDCPGIVPYYGMKKLQIELILFF